MSYSGPLGQIQFSPTALTPTVTTLPTASSADAWRSAIRDQALAIVRQIGAMTREEKLAGGTALTALTTSLTNISIQVMTRSKAEMAWFALVLNVPSGYDSPTKWTTAGVTALRAGLKSLKENLAALTAAAATTQPSVAPSMFMLATAPVIAPAPISVPIPAPVISPSPSEVQCIDGYVRDAAGLCVPGAAPPVTPPSVAPTTIPVAPITETSLISSGPLGISYKWWAAGALGAAAIGALLLFRRPVTPNRRRRVRRNTAFLTTGTRVRGDRGTGSVVEVHGENASVRWDSGGSPKWVKRSSLSLA